MGGPNKKNIKFFVLYTLFAKREKHYYYYEINKFHHGIEKNLTQKF